MPSGHVPANAFCNPAELLGIHCKIPVPLEAVQEMRTMVIKETGPRDHWVNDDFTRIADDVYMQIGSPALTLENAWDVFTAMSDVIRILS